MVSAHWLAGAGPHVRRHWAGVPLVYDFYGFPERYYRVTTPLRRLPAWPRASPDLAGSERGVARQPSRGLDHGSLRASRRHVPRGGRPRVAALAPDAGPGALLTPAQRLRPLRDQGVLVIGSGFMTAWLPVPAGVRAACAAAGLVEDFDQWVAAALDRRYLPALTAFREVPSARYAHPTVEHFVPLFVALAPPTPDAPMATPIRGFWLGLSKRSVQFA